MRSRWYKQLVSAFLQRRVSRSAETVNFQRGSTTMNAKRNSGHSWTLPTALLCLPLMLVACSRASQGPAPVPAAPPSADEWRVEWVQATIPEEMPRASLQHAQLTVRNLGDRGIATANLSISYHWFENTPAGLVQAVWDGIRTPVTVVLEPGSTLTSSFEVKAPDKPGSYILVVDLVRDNVSWFSAKGAPQFTRPVKIL